MLKSTKKIRNTLLSAPLLLALAACNSGSNTTLDTPTTQGSAVNSFGSAQFALSLPDNLTTDVVVAQLTGPGIDQTHDINVSGNGAVSLYLDGLTPGEYTIALSSTLSDGQQCQGSASFTIVADTTQLVEVVLQCPGGVSGTSPSGSASITASFAFDDSVACDHVEKVIAFSATQLASNSPASDIEVYLNADVQNASVSMTLPDGTALATTASGNAVTTSFDCAGQSGVVDIAVDVTALENGTECTESGLVKVTCPVGTCGDGVIEGSEECDGTALPAGVPAGITCGADCTLPPFCGDGNVDPGEACDGSANCNDACEVVVVDLCGNGAIDEGEACDGDVLPAGVPAGTSCEADCSAVGPFCGDGVINGTEVCDGDALPAGATGSCSSDCSAVQSDLTECAACQQQFCTFQLNEINASPENLAEVDEVMSCAWSADWDEGAAAPEGACAQTGTRDCLCGPDQLDLLCQVTGGEGPCYDLFVEKTQCDPPPAGQTVGQCTGNLAQNTDNPAGDAMQLVVCTRVNCVDACNVTPLL